MLYSRTLRWRIILVLLVVGIVPFPAAQLTAASVPHADPPVLQAAFAAAAQEFSVPERVLLAVSYNLSRWEHHHGAPSVAGGYGLMHLTQVDHPFQVDAKGDGMLRLSQHGLADERWHTLDQAADVLDLSPEVLRHDPIHNIRGGAALLAQYARETVGALPTDEAAWYGAVAKYSGSPDAAVAFDFADAVYATIQQGVERTMADGHQVRLATKDVVPNKTTADSLALPFPLPRIPECPVKLLLSLTCRFIPAAYQLNTPGDPTDYGNYDLANRPQDGLAIRYIVLHDTEVDYITTLRIFQNPQAYVSAHYVIRAADGRIAQMVENKNVAWHAGNWYVNGHAIGIEHEGIAIEGATWFTEHMYRTSAELVKYLAHRYNVPLDRAHIIGSDEVPGPTPAYQEGMHWDPGPFWDWAHYMKLLGAPIAQENDEIQQSIVTIHPNFDTNTPPLTYCYGPGETECRTVPPQPSNFVYLRTAPRPDAPLISDPYIGSEPTRAYNWANKAVTGQQFYRVERSGDWDAISFGGHKAWFYNPANQNAVNSTGTLVTPKAGAQSIPVYGRAYPEASAYPSDVPPQELLPLYAMPAGQRYVAIGPVRSDFYWAPKLVPTLEDAEHTVIEGETQYYQIFYNHRFGYVKASDVDVISAP